MINSLSDKLSLVSIDGTHGVFGMGTGEDYAEEGDMPAELRGARFMSVKALKARARAASPPKSGEEEDLYLEDCESVTLKILTDEYNKVWGREFFMFGNVFFIFAFEPNIPDLLKV